MNIQQKEFKRKMLSHRIVWMFLGGILYVVLDSILSKNQIKNTSILTMCKVIFDFSVIFLGNQLFRAVIMIISRINNNRDDFDSRFKIHFLEFISIGVFIYSFRFKWCKSWLWLDIILFIWFFLSLIISNNSYLNILKIFKISEEANDKYNQKKAMYEKVKCEVEEFNLKEKELLEVRLKYAQSDGESDKAYRDQRSYTVDRKKDPDYYTFPSRPPFEDCTGIVGLFSGKEDILNYEKRVEQYKSALEKAYKNQDKKSRELQARMSEAETAIRYVAGTEIDQKIEEELQGRGTVDRAQKARESYKKFDRGRLFERRNRKF